MLSLKAGARAASTGARCQALDPEGKGLGQEGQHAQHAAGPR